MPTEIEKTKTKIVRLNALKHGILAATKTEYDTVNPQDIYDALAEEFGSATPSRKMLLEIATQSYVRLCRCTRGETELLAECLHPKIEKNPLSFDFVEVIDEGTPATLSSENWEKFALIYERYEPRHANRFLQVISILSATKPCR